MQSRWMSHNGKKILVMDYSNFRKETQKVLAEVDEAHRFILQQPPTSTLVLVDIQNTVMSLEVVNSLKQKAAESQKHINKIAVVGVSSGVLEILYRAVINFSGLKHAAVFPNVDRAKAWLTVN